MTTPDFKNMTTDEYKAWADKRNAEVRAERRASWDATTGAIKAYLAGVPDDFRGAKNAEPRDLSDLAKLATGPGRGNSLKPIYKPADGCKCTFKLSEAVSFAYVQDAYADYSYYALSVTGDVDDVCKANLRRFCRCLITANGLAGFGSTWESELHHTEAGWVAILISRSSIAD